MQRCQAASIAPLRRLGQLQKYVMHWSFARTQPLAHCPTWRRPAQVFRICDLAMRKTFSTACANACNRGAAACEDYKSTSAYAALEETTCKQYEYVLPRPTMKNVCRAGFKMGGSLGCETGARALADAMAEEDAAAMAAAFEEEVGSDASADAEPLEDEEAALAAKGVDEGVKIEEEASLEGSAEEEHP